MDRHANAANTGSVGLRHIVARRDGYPGAHLDLATNVEQKRLIRHTSDFYILDGLNCLNDLGSVVLPRRVDSEVADHPAFGRLHNVNTLRTAPGHAYCRGDFAKHSGIVRIFRPHRDAVGNARRSSCHDFHS